MDDFAYAFPELRSLESLLSGLSDSDLSDMGTRISFMVFRLPGFAKPSDLPTISANSHPSQLNRYRSRPAYALQSCLKPRMRHG